MTPKEKAKQLIISYSRNKDLQFALNDFLAKECALIAVDNIINSNPHSNPLNTNVYSTMDWWQEVKQEIEKL
jgi:hypothetical protein